MMWANFELPSFNGKSSMQSIENRTFLPSSWRFWSELGSAPKPPAVVLLFESLEIMETRETLDSLRYSELRIRSLI